MTAIRSATRVALVGAAVGLGLVLFGPRVLASGQAPPPQAGGRDYAGQDTCLTCHEDMLKGYEGSPHARVKDARSPAATSGCESCHGPGRAHADSAGDTTKIRQFTKLSAADASAACIRCHNPEHAEWQGSKHESRNMSCLTCHSVHEPRSADAQLKTETQTETCAQCHRTEVNKIRRAAHMPVREGKMECTTCHNPHGSRNVKMLGEGNSVVESCVSCHAEKRGPFLWEHAPVRESCTICHDPHGSNTDRMLTAKLPMLCQRCHVASRHPATIYDQTAVGVTKSNRVVGRGCVNCHQMIHGSNHPASGKIFIR